MSGRDNRADIQRLLTGTIYLVALPSFLIYIAHFFFVSSYTGGWTVEAFESRYTSGIYRYRVLGRELVRILTDVNRGTIFGSFAPHSIDTRFDGFYPPLYWAYFQLNCIFWIGTCIVWWRALRERCDSEIRLKLIYSLLLLSSVVGMSVVVPYDMLSFFLLSLTFVTFHYRYRIAVPLLIVLTILGTLTRETQVLAITYAGVVLVVEGADRENTSKFVSVLLPFLITYSGLRLYYGTTKAAAQSVELSSNLTAPLRILGLLGILLFILLFMDITPSYEKKRDVNIVLLILSSPYLAMILLFARVVEFRLIVPLLIIISFIHPLYRDRELEFRLLHRFSNYIG